MKSISEQLTAKQAELKTKAAKLEELHGVDSPTNEQIEERDTLVLEVKDLTAETERLETLERAQARGARPVIVPASQSSPIQHAEVKDNPAIPKGIGFARSVICKIAAMKTGESPLTIAKARYPSHTALHAYIKAAVAGGITTDGTDANGGWAGPLVRAENLASEFIELLMPMTILGKFGTGGIPSLRRIPFNVRITGQDGGGTGYWVGEAKAKPLTAFSFNAVTLLWAKVAAIAVISDELARFSSPSAEGLVRDALTSALQERLDVDFIDPDKVVAANVSPASITNGVTAIPASGTGADDVRKDVESLINLFIAANINLTQGVFIMPNSVALALSLMRNALGNPEFPSITMNGGTLLGFPVITSQYAAVHFASPTNNLVILASASDIFLSDDGQVTVDVSREASLEMSDTPETESGTVVSMYQTNQIALRAERFINWAKRRTDAVQYIEHANYTASSST